MSLSFDLFYRVPRALYCPYVNLYKQNGHQINPGIFSYIFPVAIATLILPLLVFISPIHMVRYSLFSLILL